MTKLVSAEILDWVAAPDMEPVIAELPAVARDGALVATQADRALLVETAIKSALYDKRDLLEGVIDVALEQRDEIDAILGEKSTPKEELKSKSGHDNGEGLEPFTLILQGRWRMAEVTEANRYTNNHGYTSFKEKIQEATGATDKTAAL